MYGNRCLGNCFYSPSGFVLWSWSDFTSLNVTFSRKIPPSTQEGSECCYLSHSWTIGACWLGPQLPTLGPITPGPATRHAQCVCVGFSHPLTCSEHVRWAWAPSVVPSSEGDTKSHTRTVGLKSSQEGPASSR